MLADNCGIAIWLEWWSSANEEEPRAREGMYLGVYSGVGVAATVFMAAACWYVSPSRVLVPDCYINVKE